MPFLVESILFVALVALLVVGLVIRQARAREARRARNLRALFEVSRQATASLDQQQMLDVVVQAVQDVMGYRLASILLLDEDRQELVSAAISSNLRGLIPLGDRIPIGRGMVGAAIRTGQTQLASDVTRNPHYIRAPGSWDPGSEISVPLLSGQRRVGVLDVQDAARNAFTRDDVQVLEALAEQLVVILEKARLFESTQANVERLSILYDLSQRISQARDDTTIMREALEALAAHSPYRCTIALFEFDATGRPHRFRVPFFYQPGQGLVAANVYVPATDDELNPLLNAGQTVAITDVATDARVPEFLRQEQLASGRPALVLIPLVVGGRRIGNLVLSHSEPHVWTDGELQLFRSSANQLAATLENARLFGDVQRALEEMRLLYETARQFGAALSLDEVIEVYLEQVAARSGRFTCSVVLYEFDEAGERTAVIAHAHWTPRSGLLRVREPYPNERDDLDVILETGQSVRVTDIRLDPRAPQRLQQALAERPALAMLPLIVRGRCMGLVAISETTPHAWTDDDLWPYQATASQLAIAIDSRRQQVLLAERGQQLAVLEERQRLARDLHDSVTQLIFSLMLIAQSVGPAYKRDLVEGERRIGRMLELSQQALAEMRALLAELRPTSPVASGLLPALRQHLERVAEREKLHIHLQADAYRAQSPEREEMLYRVAQESLNNVVKHARAQTVTLALTPVNGSLTLVITDDGRGFNPTQAAGGIGLPGMRERVERLGGALKVQSAPNTGTTICVTLPEPGPDPKPTGG